MRSLQVRGRGRFPLPALVILLVGAVPSAAVGAVPSAAVGAVPSAAAVPSPKDKPPLDQVIRSLEDRYNRLNTLKASFTQFYREDNGPTREESGVIYLAKPGRMRWEYSRPEVKFFISNGKTLYFYAPEDKQVTRTSVKESDDSRVPLAFLLGKLNIKRMFSSATLAKDAAPLDPGNPVLRLVPKRPKDGEAAFREILLEMDGAGRIRRLVILEASGARSEFRLSLEEANPRLDPALFRFTIPAGVEIVDERSNP